MAWLSGYTHRRLITITNNIASELTNFQVPVDLDLLEAVEASNAKSDLTDIRVTSDDGVTLLNFYREYTGNDFGNLNNYWRWEENPVINTGGGGSWDDYWVHPNSIINVSGTLYMYYSGGQGTTDPNKIGLATSSDGITWSKYGSNPIVSPGTTGAWDDTAVNHFCVLNEGASWYAWYAGHGGDSAWSIGYATSNDGVSWSKYGSNPIVSGTVATWDSAFVAPSQVWKEGNTYYMLYWGGTSTSDSTTWEIGLATSTDRVAWTKEATNPILEGVDATWEDGVLDVHAVKIGSTYYMFYQGNDSTGTVAKIGIASSTNLTSWTKDPDNPLPNGANSGEWDFAWNEGPLLYQMGTTWYMYYMGNKENGTTTDRLIGLQKFMPTRLWVKVPSIPASSVKTIYIYHGKPDAPDINNGTDTFLFFEDFTGGLPFGQWNNTGSFTSGTDRGDANAEKTANNTNTTYYLYSTGTISAPCTVEVRSKVGADWASEYSWNFRLDLTDAGGGLANALLFGHYKDATPLDRYYFMRYVSSLMTHTQTDDRSINSSVWTKLTLYIPATGTCIAKYHNGTRSLSIAADVPDTTPFIQLATGRGGETSDYTTNFDKVWVRGYAATEPSVSIGEDEVQLSYGPVWQIN